jgi:uncharacterized protein
MRILFYLVHPAKYHFHKIQINKLIENGHDVNIVINTKDILEELVKKEGWKYKNIFPKSRKIKGVHVYIAAVISIFITVYRLWKYTRGKKYDLFIGDLTTLLGCIVHVPTFYPTDDVLAAVPEQTIFFKTVKYIIAPEITDVGKYKIKKIGYHGYKALAHLHPNHFKPDIKKLFNNLQNGKHFFLIRCTGFMATHDLNKSGISNNILYELIKNLEPYGDLFISSERKLPPDLDKYKLNINKNDIFHYIAFAKIFISDSTTMSTEAAILGTPSIEFDEYFYEIEQMIELEKKYGLIHCFRTNQQKEFLEKVIELVKIKNLKRIYLQRRYNLLNDTIDVSAFLTWLFENYPESVKKYFNNPNIQDKFKTKYQNICKINRILKKC